MTEPREPLSNAGQRDRQRNEARARELLEQERQFIRAQRRLVAETGLGVIASCAIGLYLVGWAVHTTDARLGEVAFWCGLVVGDIGMVTFLLRHFRRIEDI